MNTIKAKNRSKYSLLFIYASLFILVALYVFVANDENQALIEIFQWNYLIPVSIYALGAIWLSYVLFLLFLRKMSVIISFIISTFIGIPVGIMLVAGLFNLISL